MCMLMQFFEETGGGGILMLKTVAAWAGLIVLTGALAGCDFGNVFLFATEDKINAAFPISEAVRNGKDAVLDLADRAQRKEIEAQLNTRLKLRALSCSKEYSPAWYSSSEEIRKNLDGQSCFAEADNEIARWLGIRRVGLILAKPALKPIPKSAPRFIVADGYIQNARFAVSAGISLLETQQAIEIVDFESMKPMFRETKGSTTLGSLSPNGRLFTTGEGDRLKIRDTESGTVIAEIPSVRAFEFYWLDERTALYNKSNSGKAFFIDFKTGKEIPVEAIIGGVQRAVRVPGADNEYVLFSYRGVTKVELVRGKAEPEVKLLAEKPISGIAWTSNTSDATANGTHYFSANRQLTLVSLESLEIETISFEPFYLQTGAATPDPDKIIFTGFTQPPQGESPRNFVYSISNRTLMPIDPAKVSSQRYMYVAPLRSQAVITDNKIALVGKLPTLETIPLSSFIADTLAVANQRKLDAFERQQAQQAAPIIGTSSLEFGQSGIVGPIADLARDAQIEAVGVYQGGAGESRTNDGRKMGYVEVRLRRSAKPVVLVLSSYEPVRWKLIPESGARLAAVLVSGYYPSQVVGAGAARIVMTGSVYAYKLGSPEYNLLNREIVKWTGKSIGIFQGRYEGSAFSVGG